MGSFNFSKQRNVAISAVTAQTLPVLEMRRDFLATGLSFRNAGATFVALSL